MPLGSTLSQAFSSLAASSHCEMLTVQLMPANPMSGLL
jgi:hypothetical protein